MTYDGLLTAVQLLTRLPVPHVERAEAGSMAGVQVWVPAVGLLIGCAVALGLLCGIFWGRWIGALIALLVWVAITGALHLDGLGDAADGLGAAHAGRERFLEAARDPHAGNFAIVAISLQLVCKLVLLAAINPAASFLAVALVPAWARWGALVLAWRLPPLGEGMAARFAPGVGVRMIIVWGVLLAAASGFAMPVLVLAVGVVALLVLFWRRKLGAISGDGHGASIEVTETALLALIAVAGA